MLVEHLPAAAAKDEAQHDRDENRVVELAGNRDEVGNHVDRQRQVSEQADERKLAGASHSIVAEEASKEDQTVGDEAGKRPRFTVPACEEQPTDECRIDAQCHRD